MMTWPFRPSLTHSPLLVGQLGAGLGDGLHGRGHVVVPLGLLGQLGALDLLLLVGHVECEGENDDDVGNAKNKLQRMAETWTSDARLVTSNLQWKKI